MSSYAATSKTAMCSRRFLAFGNLTAVTDRLLNDVAHVLDLAAAHLADVFADTPLVDSLELLKEHDGRPVQPTGVFNVAMCPKVSALVGPGCDRRDNQRGAEIVSGVILEHDHRSGAALFAADIWVKVCDVDIASAVIPVFIHAGSSPFLSFYVFQRV